MLNLTLGTLVLSNKSPRLNRIVQHIYFFPVLLGVLLIFLAYQLFILPVAYVKMFFHKFALVVNNPQGVGAKSKSNRLGYAVLWTFVGPFILMANYFVDIYWFFKHVYLTEE